MNDSGKWKLINTLLDQKPDGKGGWVTGYSVSLWESGNSSLQTAKPVNYKP